MKGNFSNDFNEFGILLGCAANSVPKISTLKKYADIMKKLGYNSLYLETADTYQIEDEPYFGYNRGVYTKAEIKELEAYCDTLGIELVPTIQTLAHMHFLKNYERFRPIIDSNDILLAEYDETYVFIEKMFKTMAEMYKCRRINIGMDEAFLLGAGNYLKKFGHKDRVKILFDHLDRVLKIAKKYGFQCEMWSDMFFSVLSAVENPYEALDATVPAEWKSLVPDGLKLVYWEYFPQSSEMVETMIDKHRQIADDVKFAGTFFRWSGIAPLNAFTNKVMKRALKACKNKQVKDFIFAAWSDYSGGASIFATLPSMYAMSKYAVNGCDDDADLTKGFSDVTGIDYKDFAYMDAVNYPYTDTKTKDVSDLRANNKSHFYLFCDIMYGIFDNMVSDGISKAYENLRDEMKKIDGKEYQYLFDTIITLADVLSIKASISKNMRALYKAGDKEGLKNIAKVILPSLLEKYDAYFNAFEKQWMLENKPFGYEVQNIRFGGLKERALYAKKTIEKYLAGEISEIAEFEIEQMPYGGAAENVTEDNYHMNRYTPIAAHGFI